MFKKLKYNETSVTERPRAISKMLYDLNVPWSATDSPLQQQRTISFLSELGYDTLALNHTISSSLPSQITNPIPSPPPFEIPQRYATGTGAWAKGRKAHEKIKARQGDVV